MAKRAWSVTLRARPQSDGSERLAQAVKLVIDREVLDRKTQAASHDRATLGMQASVGVLEELDS
jgi:hypothetical protein